MVDGDIPPQLILEFLEARAFLAQMPAQGLCADVQVLGHGVQVGPATGVTAEQAAQLAAQAVAVVGAGQQVGRGPAEKLLEGPLILQQRHAQVAAGEQQASVRRRKFQGAGKQQVVLVGVFGARVLECGLFQADALADQPTAEAMPDHQQAFTEKMIRVPQVRGVEDQAGLVAFADQAQARRVGKQPVEQQPAVQGLFQVGAMDQRVAHHGECATLAAALAEAQVLVVQFQPQALQQLGELFGRQARLRFAQEFGSDPQPLQQARTGVTPPPRAFQGGVGKMAGDAAFSHGAVPSVEWRILARDVRHEQGGYPPISTAVGGGRAEIRHLCCKGWLTENP